MRKIGLWSFCDHQVVNPFFDLGLCYPSSVEVVLLWVCDYPSCVEMIVVVIWLSALPLLCRGDHCFGLVPCLLCRGDCIGEWSCVLQVLSCNFSVEVPFVGGLV